MDIEGTVERITTSGRIFKTLVVDAGLAPYVNFNAIAAEAKLVGGHFAVYFWQDGRVTVTIYWAE